MQFIIMCSLDFLSLLLLPFYSFGLKWQHLGGRHYIVTVPPPYPLQLPQEIPVVGVHVGLRTSQANSAQITSDNSLTTSAPPTSSANESDITNHPTPSSQAHIGDSSSFNDPILHIPYQPHLSQLLRSPSPISTIHPLSITPSSQSHISDTSSWETVSDYHGVAAERRHSH